MGDATEMPQPIEVPLRQVEARRGVTFNKSLTGHLFEWIA